MRMSGGKPSEPSDEADRLAASSAAARGLEIQGPLARPDWVGRRRLLDELDGAALRPVVLLAAAAGYGKTTLVSQWLAEGHSPPRASAWLTLHAVDNDPGVLCGRLAAALEQAGCPLEVDPVGLAAGERRDLTAAFLPRLVTAMAGMPQGLVLVLDDFQVVQNPECLMLVQRLIEHLPPGARLVIATRADPTLRLGRLRAGGRLTEIRAADLAFTADEVTSLLAICDVKLSDESMLQLLERTEGWPAGLGLAILSLREQADPDAFVRKLGGSNRFIGDYLTEEVLSQQPESMRSFILTMSIVDRLCAGLCDFVLETTGSARLLRELEQANTFLLALDDERRWFRFHPLFAAVARGELEAQQPDRLPMLHARAAQWFRAEGHLEEALTHLLASGDTEDAARVLQANWMAFVDAGHTATVLRWSAALDRPSIASDPASGVTAAWMAGLAGDEATLTAQVAALGEFRDHGPLPDGTHSVESALSMIQGLFGYGGPEEMLAGARRAVELETTAGSPQHAIAHLSLGHAAYVAGDLQVAADALTEASRNTAAPASTRMLALSIQSLVESERGQPQLSRMLAEQAMEIAEQHGLAATSEASMAFTALGQAQGDAGERVSAMSTLEQGLALRRKDPAQAPWLTLHHLLAMARVAADAGQLSWARERMDEASRQMDRFAGGMGPMRARLATIEPQLHPPLEPAAPAEPLTRREDEVLHLLRGTLSLVEIARELDLSPNTVKTHTQTLYRKLGAESRAAAVIIARQRRLL
jgi:LuxR family transcriptional regulator, maltose regulon positive regulatory protein